jgi:hypothetical protein
MFHRLLYIFNDYIFYFKSTKGPKVGKMWAWFIERGRGRPFSRASRAVYYLSTPILGILDPPLLTPSLFLIQMLEEDETIKIPLSHPGGLTLRDEEAGECKEALSLD